MTLATKEFIPFPRESGEYDPSSLPASPKQDTEITRGRAQTGCGPVDYTYERPLEMVTDEVPLLIEHGYIGIETGYRKLRGQIAQSGKPAVTLTPARVPSLGAALDPDYFLHPGALASRAAYGVLSDVQERYDHDVFDLAGHSMAGWTISALAKRHPGKIRSATYVASVGLEDHSTLSLARRLPDFAFHEVLPNLSALAGEHDPAVILEFLHYIWRNPYRTAVEGVGLSNCDNRPTIVEIGNAGVKTAILNFANDRLICNKTTQAEMEDKVDHCETHPDESLGHLAPNLQPEIVATRLTHIINKINAGK